MAETVGALFSNMAIASHGAAGTMVAGQFVPSVGNPWAGAVAGGGSSASSTALSILEGAASGFAALSAIGRGIAERDLALSEAADLDQRAREEMLISETEAAKAKKTLLKQLGKQQVGYAASGVDLSQGTVKIASRQASEDAEQDLSTSRTLAQSRVARFRRAAAARRYEAEFAEAGGMLDAAGGLGKFGASLMRRG